MDTPGAVGRPADHDIAHWLVCADGEQRVVHLGYFAPPNSGSSVILPHDLMTADEQQWLGRSII
ncbi:hypothetical protein [Embleya sp. AB8]|uniref:hypothetical protein n=1 Tax=Embleya sp. AB8 TaxID=3156304 RepID=UPI003C734720